MEAREESEPNSVLQSPEFEELAQYVTAGTLSKSQFDILRLKLCGASYEHILAQKLASGPCALSHCLRRTCLCLYWCPGLKTGPDPYLCAPDTEKFRELVCEACDDVNCVTTCRALHLAFDLRRERLRRAAKLLLSAGCDRLADGLGDPIPPSRPWLNTVCSNLEIHLCRAQELEAARRIYCDFDAVTQWFVHFSDLFQRDPLLLFNMDETQLTTKKHLRVLCPEGQRPLVTAPPVSPHITAAVTVNAAGYRVRPLIILPNKKTTKTLEGFTHRAYFSSSSSGWMTKNLFRYYAMCFVAELSLIRLQYPKRLREEPVLLFVDGHPSRWDFKACLILWLFNVDCVTFPGHTSHLLQMFDVCLAGPLKHEFKKQVLSGNFENVLTEEERANFAKYRKLNAKGMRAVMIHAFLTAYEKIFTTDNSAKSFSATGIAPLSPQRVIESSYCMDPPSQHIFRARQSKASGKWLTSEESLREMFRDENRRELTEEDLKQSLDEIYGELRAASIEHGIPLGDPPEFLSKHPADEIYKLLTFTK